MQNPLAKIPVRKLYKVSKTFLVKHSADILTGFTAAGVVITAFETRKATLRAEEYLKQNGYYDSPAMNDETKKVLKMQSMKEYIAPAVIGATTISAAVGANYINHKQIAGLAAACTVAETALTEHRDKIEELLGEKTLTKIDDAVNVDRGHDILADESKPVLVTGHGDMLCCEGYLTGTKFRASTDWVKKCVNEFNYRVNNDTYADFSEFLLELWQDCPSFVIPRAAENVGYNVHSTGLMRLDFTSDIDPVTGEPYLIFTPRNIPVSNFTEIW